MPSMGRGGSARVLRAGAGFRWIAVAVLAAWVISPGLSLALVLHVHDHQTNHELHAVHEDGPYNDNHGHHGHGPYSHTHRTADGALAILVHGHAHDADDPDHEHVVTAAHGPAALGKRRVERTTLPAAIAPLASVSLQPVLFGHTPGFEKRGVPASGPPPPLVLRI